MELGSQVWMSHADTITRLPDGYRLIARTNDIGVAAFRDPEHIVFGLQFHPEVYHSKQGALLLKNFLVDICGCSQDWTPESFIHSTVEGLKKKLGNDRVVLGFRAVWIPAWLRCLLHKAIGRQLHCIFVDNGLLAQE
jgi:GMP synthase (glutamine-hydrolysing)